MSNLPAGRELDAMVAEKVMGLCDHTLVDNEVAARAEMLADARRDFETDYGQPPPEKWEPSFYGDDYYCRCTKCGKTWAIGGSSCGPSRSGWLPKYSTEIAVAWQVVETLANRKPVLEALSCVIGTNAMSGGRQNGCKFYPAWQGAGHSIYDAEPHDGWDAVAESIPHAICLAALAAVLGRTPEDPTPDTKVSPEETP